MLVSLICCLICFYKIHPSGYSVFSCCCIQCRHFQVADGAGNGNVLQYVHLCSTLFVLIGWCIGLFLICFFYSPRYMVDFYIFLALHLSASFVFYVLGWWVVFKEAGDFNADISKWDTGQVTVMRLSTSTSVPTLFVHWTVLLICFLIFF